MKTVTYDETKWKLAPLEPVAEILAGASESIWSVVTPKDMEIAEQAALILLRKSQGSGPFPSVRDTAKAIANMAPAYRAMIDAAPEPPAQPAVSDVMDELAKAVAKFPTWPTDPFHAVAVLNEECGELNKALLQQVYEPHKNEPGAVRKEALQTAAMALRFLRSLDVYKFGACEQHEQQESMS